MLIVVYLPRSQKDGQGRQEPPTREQGRKTQRTQTHEDREQSHLKARPAAHIQTNNVNQITGRDGQQSKKS